MSDLLEITQNGNVLKLKNVSDFIIHVLLTPKDKEIKLEKKITILPKSCFIYDSVLEWSLNDHYFRIEEKKV